MWRLIALRVTSESHHVIKSFLLAAYLSALYFKKLVTPVLYYLVLVTWTSTT